MKAIITALGSYGDVHPMIGLGKALLQRGHDPWLVANEQFASIIAKAGLHHIPFLTSEEYDELSKNPDLWHPIRGPKFVLQHGTAGYLRPLYDLILKHVVPNETVLVAHGLDMASRVIQEKHGIPMATVALAPLQMRSNIAPPKMPGFITRNQPFLWPRRFQFWVADKCFIDPILKSPINALRAELGLNEPVSRIYDHWWYSPELVLCFFPEWFAPNQPDWPEHSLLTGFPFWDDSDTTEMDPELLAFLEDGPPPIVFCPGSAMRFRSDFFTCAVTACQALGTRGILLTKYPEQLPEELPIGIKHFDYIPFSQVLPRSAVFVHHGGIGSCSQGLLSGVPHLVMPTNFDQPDNAERLKQLGVAEVVEGRRIDESEVISKLRKLLNREQYSVRLHALSEQCKAKDGMIRAAEAIESLANSRYTSL